MKWTLHKPRHATVLFVMLFVTWCIAVVWLQHLRLSAGVHYEYEDDALYLQILHFVGDGLIPHNTIHPLHRPSHITPAYFALWPIFAAMGGGWTAAFILKALLIGGAAFPVYFFAARRVRARYAVCLAVIWLVCAPTLALVQSTLRPLTLAATPLMAMMLSFIDRNLRTTMIWSLVVLSFREDLGLTILLLSGIALLERRDWRWIVWPAALAITWLVFSTQVLLPMILPDDYSRVVLATNLSGGLPFVERLIEPSHLGAILVVLVSFALLPLRSLITLAGGVGLAAILLNRHTFTANLVHLAMPWVVAAFAGAVKSVVTSHTGPRLAAIALCSLAVHSQSILPPTVHIAPVIHDGGSAADATAWSPLHPANYDQSDQDRARLEAIQHVPTDAAVTAVGHLLPWLSPRNVLYEYGHRYVTFTMAEWAVLEANEVGTESGGHISLRPNELPQHVDLLHSAGWQTKYTNGQIVVLQRTGLPPQGLATRLRQLLEPRMAAPTTSLGAPRPD